MPLDPYIDHGSRINWKKIIIVFSGILTIIVLITIFVIIPNYVKVSFDNKVQAGINSLSVNHVDSNNGYDCSADVYNCSNFTTQQDAQAAYIYCRKQGVGDIHNLDPKGDGLACENLP